MKVKITMEKTYRVAKEFDVTEEQLEQLRLGDNPFYEELEKDLDKGDLEYDYTVTDMDDGIIVDWR